MTTRQCCAQARKHALHANARIHYAKQFNNSCCDHSQRTDAQLDDFRAVSCQVKVASQHLTCREFQHGHHFAQFSQTCCDHAACHVSLSKGKSVMATCGRHRRASRTARSWRPHPETSGRRSAASPAEGAALGGRGTEAAVLTGTWGGEGGARGSLWVTRPSRWARAELRPAADPHPAQDPAAHCERKRVCAVARLDCGGSVKRASARRVL